VDAQKGISRWQKATGSLQFAAEGTKQCTVFSRQLFQTDEAVELKARCAGTVLVDGACRSCELECTFHLVDNTS